MESNLITGNCAVIVMREWQYYSLLMMGTTILVNWHGLEHLS